MTSALTSKRNGLRPWLALVGLVVPVNLMMALDKNSFALAAPRIGQTLGLDYVHISLVISALSWSYAVMQLPSGWLVHRLGPRRALGMACLLWSVTTMLMPLSAGFVSFLVLRMAMGAFQAPDWSASVVAVHDWFAPERRSRGNAVLLGALYLGSTLAGPLTTETTLMFGWQRCLFVFGCFGAVLSVVWLLLFRDGPYRHREDTPALLPDKHVVYQLATSGGFWAIGGFYLCMLAVQSFYHVTLPQYLLSARHLSYREMGWVFSLPWFCLYGSVVTSGFVSDRIYARTGSVFQARVLFGAAGAVTSALSLEAAALCHGTIASVVLLCAALAALGPCQVSIWTLAQELTRHHAAVVVGWAGFCGNLAAGVVPVLTAHLLKTGLSWPNALLLPCLLGVLGAVCCLLTGYFGQIDECQNTSSSNTSRESYDV
ncbi:MULTISPECIES: MFS transporter [Gluconobacter]|uniref:MFS transporter n=1 Tax=Gluconobacter cadivus TaxID=2728101 RepID=A0ABR9YYD7_9PROT|nr:MULTISPECIES: MFS transporter [Gluconobacter]MBF0889576.1 MFS transporter [Gluconobacter cadivus]MBS1061218.1 MFS transporter [Gluconobacter sp. Dm-44]